MEKQVIEYFGLLSEVFGAIAAYIQVFSFFALAMWLEVQYSWWNE